MKKYNKILILFIVLFTLTGCTRYLKDDKNKNVTNPNTGQSLTENILCRPTDVETIKIYLRNGIDLEKLPYCSCGEDNLDDQAYRTSTYTDIVYTGDANNKVSTPDVYTGEKNNGKCEEFKITSGGYDGIWSSIFVKPLAWLILFFGKIFSNFGVGLIIVSLLMRLILFPLTRKTAIQSEQMKKIQPELDRLEKKYASKDQSDQQVMMMKSQEMMAIYKKYHFNPIMGCLTSFIQLPLLIAFLEAINRVPAIFEENFLGLYLGMSPGLAISHGQLGYIAVILLVAATTFFSFRNMNNNNSSNPDIARQTKMMTNTFLVMIIVMSIFMSTALCIYWTVSNLFVIIQTVITKRSVK